MAIPIHNEEYATRKKEAKKLIAAGGCVAIKFWSNTDSIRLCPEEYKSEVDFQPLEGMVYISEWLDAAKKAVELINKGIALLDTIPSPKDQPEGQSPPDWYAKWIAAWLYKLECQGVDPKVRAGFKIEAEWLYGKISEETSSPAVPSKEIFTKKQMEDAWFHGHDKHRSPDAIERFNKWLDKATYSPAVQPEEKEHIHMQLAPGVVARVAADAKPELLAALTRMVELAKEMPEPTEPAPAKQGGVPEEIMEWIKKNNPFDESDDDRNEIGKVWGFKKGAEAMYHKMQEEIGEMKEGKSKWVSAAMRSIQDRQNHQRELEEEIQEYRKALEIIANGSPDSREGRKAKELLDKYPHS